MKKQILYCKTCKKFTLKHKCSKCNKKTENPKPAKYSVEDKWGKYRRLAKSSQN